MGEIKKINYIDGSQLSGEFYFESLLAQGEYCALISHDEVERIKTDCLLILSKQTDIFTQGKSSSVRVETAQELLSSVLFTLGIALKAYDSPENALDALKKEPLNDLFENGQKRIRRKIQASRLLYSRLKNNLFYTENVFYRSTVIDGIKGFFKLYRPRLFAREIHITADYPLLLPVENLAGIEYIEKYLHNVTCENSFCLKFSPQSVHHLLSGVDKNYRLLVMNIFEPVLTEAVLCVLSNRPAQSLDCDRKAVKALFADSSFDNIQAAVMLAVQKLGEELSCSDWVLKYLNACVGKIASSIELSLRFGYFNKNTSLQRESDENKDEIVLFYGERMDDNRYREIIEKLNLLENADDIANVILNNVKSFCDLLEVLRDLEQSEDVFLKILLRLSPEAIVALCAHYRNGEFLSDEKDKKVYNALRKYVSLLPRNIKNQLDDAVKASRFEAF